MVGVLLVVRHHFSPPLVVQAKTAYLVDLKVLTRCLSRTHSTVILSLVLYVDVVLCPLALMVRIRTVVFVLPLAL